MSRYFTSGTQSPNYFQFPDYLLRAPISQTAKLAYMILFDRSRLSKQNGWADGYGIYTIYPIKDMAETLGKSVSTIKSVYNELEGNDLLIRKDAGFSKANILYVLIPDYGQFPDRVRKQYSVGTENDTYDGQISVLTTVSIPPPNKNNMNKNNINQNNGVIERIPFGRYKNILLSQAEYESWKVDMPNRADELIEKMSEYCEAHGKQYKNYSAALRSWAGNEKGGKRFEDYSYEEGESF